MATLNKVILLGNAGKAPEVRTIEGGKKVAQFTLATQSGYGEKATTEWHNIVVWEKLAEVAEKFVKKGSHLYIEGSIRTRSYESNGAKRYVTEIVAYDLKLDDTSPRAEANEAPAAPAPKAAPRPMDVNNTEDLPF